MTTRPSSARIVLWLLAAALALPCAAPAEARRAPDDMRLQGGRSLTPTEQFERGRQAFLNGEYERAVSILAEVDPLALTDKGDPVFTRDDRIALHEMMGKAYFILDADDPRAAEQFLEVLKLDPDHDLDPVSTPAAIIGLFGEVRGKHERSLRRYPADLGRTLPGRAVPLVAERDRIFAIAPAGIFRWVFLGTPGKGAAMFFLGQVAPFGLSAFSYGYLSWAADKCSNATIRRNAETFYVVNILSATAACIVYVIGIVDAVLSQRYHDRAAPTERVRKRRAGAGWRWGPPVALMPPGPD